MSLYSNTIRGFRIDDGHTLGTEIWYENRSAHARPTYFCSYQNHKRVFADLSSVQNQERKSQAVNQRSCRWRHSMTYAALPFVLQFAKLQMRRTADEWWGQSQLIALQPRIRRCLICESSVIPPQRCPREHLCLGHTFTQCPFSIMDWAVAAFGPTRQLGGLFLAVTGSREGKIFIVLKYLLYLPERAMQTL